MKNNNYILLSASVQYINMLKKNEELGKEV